MSGPRRPPCELSALEAADRLRAVGLPSTAPRVAILRALTRAYDHPNPEALHARLTGERPNLSLATVYKALHAFARVGLVHEVSVAGDNARRFDANLDVHHHLVCRVCHAVRDLYDPRLAAVAPPAALAGFEPEAVSVNVLGRCEACAATAGSNAPRAPRPVRRRPRARHP